MHRKQLAVSPELLLTLLEDKPSVIIPRQNLELTWNEHGLLPFPEIVLTPEQLLDSAFVYGQQTRMLGWDTALRLTQAQNAIRRAQVLKAAGAEDVVLSGEFVEEIAAPRGISGYFICNIYDYSDESLLNRVKALDKQLNWSFCSPKGRLQMWLDDMVELWPVYRVADQQDLMYSRPQSHFHKNAMDRPKGVIRLKL